MKKKCIKCGIEKPLTFDFFTTRKISKDGYRNECRECRKVYYKNYEKKNKEKIAKQRKEYREKNKEFLKEYGKQYYDKHKHEIAKRHKRNHGENREKYKKRYHENREEILRKRKRYYIMNKEKINDRFRKRYQEDKQFRLSDNLRKRVNRAVKGIAKTTPTMELIGCSSEYLVKHLESQFKEGMSWDNYGYEGWHIDHIKPCSYFDLTDPKQQRECFHYTNLQPLWAEENFRKSNKINYVKEPS